MLTNLCSQDEWARPSGGFIPKALPDCVPAPLLHCPQSLPRFLLLCPQPTELPPCAQVFVTQEPERVGEEGAASPGTAESTGDARQTSDQGGVWSSA